MTTGVRASGSVDVPTQVRRVEKGLLKTYIEPGHLDVSDLDGRPEEERTPRVLSRALAAQAVRMVTGFSPQEAAATVIDGFADQGIDAIAVVEGTDPHVYVVQAKWSKNGRASSDRAAVQELLDGLRLIDDEEFTAFNPRGRQLAELAKSVMSTSMAPVTQVIVLMRADEVTDGFKLAIANGERDFNRHGEMLSHKIILSADVYESVRNDMAPAPVDIEAVLSPWFSVNEPFESYQGVVLAEQVADWVAHGTDLFNLNIRNPLGRTQINNELISTLLTEPAHFWYFNNGITILCESVEKQHQSRRTPQALPVTLTMHNASVVNGAQTVRSVAEAVQQDPDAGSAHVNVRIIVTGKARDFATRTTQTTNRQNRVEARDFIALDSVQGSIMQDMRAELGLEYGVRRGELEPHPETGCSVVEAACALACFHPNSQYAARIATTMDVLWERGSQGIYDTLFRPQPTAHLIWNSVRVLRHVRRCLHKLRPGYVGRGSALIEHGTYLVTHLVFRKLDTETIQEPDTNNDWYANAQAQIDDIVKELVPAIISTIDGLYTDRSQIRAVCADIGRCHAVAGQVLNGDNAAATTSGTKYRRASKDGSGRRPNAVSVLIDRGVLSEGESLQLSTAYPVEAEALKAWLAEDPSRGRATWVPHRTRPILWAADGKQYSPSGLISYMWAQAGWENRPVSNQGTARWNTSSGESLADLAWRTLRNLDDPDVKDIDEE